MDGQQKPALRRKDDNASALQLALHVWSSLARTMQGTDLIT